MIISPIFLITCLFYNFVRPGQISVYDIFQDFNNFNFGSQITINFMLETPLTTDSYLRLKMPFSISGASLSAYYIESDLCSNNYDYKLTSIASSSLSIDSGTYTYLLQFYKEYYSTTTTPTAITSLANNTWYKLIVKFNSPVTPLTSTIYPIEMSTISTNSDGFIIYDSNSNAGSLFYVDPPTATMTLYVNQSINYDISTTNTIPLTVMPTISILNSARFNVILTNPKFVFAPIQTCQVFYYYIDESATQQMLNASCELESNSSLLINIPLTLNPPWSYQLFVQITYPSHYETSQLQIYSLYAYTKTIVETLKTPLTISTNMVVWDSTISSVKVGWGVSLNSNTNSLFALYRNGPTQSVYNSVAFYFSPTVSIPATINGKLVVSFGASATIVKNTLAYSLDSFAGTTVSCSCTSNTVTCLNVAGFQKGTKYSISLKLSLSYDAANPSTVPSDFGLSSYYPIYKGVYSSSSLIYTKIYLNTISAFNNLDRIYQSSSLDYQGIHTKDTIAQALGTSGYGVKYEGTSTYQVLEFDLGILLTDFTSGVIGTSAGLDIYTSNLIIPDSSYTYSNSDCYSTRGTFNYLTAIGVCSIAKGSLSSVSTTNLKLGYKDAAFAASAWNSGGSYVGFGFNHLLITRHASLYVDANVLDFYFGFVTNNFGSGSTQTYYSQMLINSFTISIPSTFANVKLAISNFWTSPTGNLAGDYIASFVRFTGTLALGEAAQNFLVFFDYLNGFYDPNPSTSVPRCGFSITGECNYAEGLNSVGIKYLFLNRYQLTLKSSLIENTNFQFVIPVGTVQNQKTITLFFATSSSVGVIANIMRYTLTLNPVNVATWNLINTLGYSSITGANYGISTKGVNKVGNTETITINTYHTDTLSRFSPNDATHFGAAYSYQTSFNFINASAPISFSYSLSGTSAGQKCVYFKYLYNLVIKQYVFYCPIYSALTPTPASSSILISNFQLPFLNGVNLPIKTQYGDPTVASISNYDGLLLHYEYDAAEEVMIPNILTLPANPLVGFLYNGQRDQKIGFSFTTFNPLPYSSRVSVNTISSSFYLTLSTSHSCSIISNSGVTLPSYSCTQIFMNNKMEAYIVLSDNTQVIPSGSYKLYFYGVDVNIATPAQQTFYMKTMTGNGDIIDQSSNAILAYSSLDTPMSVRITAVRFEHYNKLARGYCNITFIINNGTMRSDQVLKFKLEALSETNQESSSHYMCQVRFVSNDSLAPMFQTCVLSDFFNDVTLVLKYDITQPNVAFKLVFRNIRTPASQNPYDFYFGLYSSYLYPLALSNNYKLPIFSSNAVNLIYPQIILYKLYNTIGSLSTLIFEVTTKAINIDVSSVILVKFPHYYIPLLTDKSKVVVFINNELIQHILIQEHWLKLFAIRTPIPSTQIFNITITGIDLPYFSTDISNFFLGFYTSNSSNLTEFGEVPDLSPYSINSVGFLNVYNLTINDNITLDFTNYDFLISFTNNITENSSLLLFDFSTDWTQFFFYYPLSCSYRLSSASPFDFNPISCFFQGMRVIVNLTNNLTQNTYYIFRLNIRNPEMIQCNLRKFTVSLSPNSSQNILLRSLPNLLNVPKQQYYDPSNLQSWKFEVLVDGQYQPTSDITIKSGTYSQLIRWSLLSGNRLDQNINLKFQNLYLDELKLYPETPVFQVGTNETFFRIGTPEVTPHDVYDIYFYIEQNPLLVVYNRPFALHLHVLDERIIIPPPSIATIPIASLGVSLPIQIDMNHSPPYQDLVVLTQLNYYPDLGIDYVGSDQFNIGVRSPLGQIVFKSLYLVDAFLKNTLGVLTLDEKSVGMYDLSVDTVTPVLIDASVANLTYANVTMDSNYSTQFVLKANFSNMAYVYYHVKNANSVLQRNFADIYNMTQNNFQYDFFDANEENLGYFAYSFPGILQNFTVKNLRANRNYSLRIWSYDLNEKSTLINTTNFTTLSKNNSYYVRAKLTFSSSIDANQLQMMSCLFCSMFRLTTNQVFSTESIRCNSSSPSINPVKTPNNFTSNLSLFHDYNSNTTYFYFLPFDFSEASENSAQSIIQSFASGSYMAYTLNANTPYGKFKFNTTFLNTSFESTHVNILTTPKITKIDSVVNARDVTLKFILNDNGFIFAVIEKINNIDKNKKNVINTPDKSKFASLGQVLTGQNRTNGTAVGSQFKFFNNETNSSANLSFVNLEPGTNYGIFYVASNEGFDNFRQFTEIKWMSISTQFEAAKKLVAGIIFMAVMIICLV